MTNKAEKAWIAKVYDYGCVVCKWFYDEESPCACHHLDGQTKKGAHLKSIGLCGNHHQIPDNNKPKRWISRHGDGKAAFEKEYGNEYDLLERLRGELNE